jgi:hypothetical protein
MRSSVGRWEMTDDILKRLRAPELYTETGWQELLSLAADRIEQLELTIWQLEVELDDVEEELTILRGKPND